MKICKHCQAAMDDEALVCGVCGEAWTEDETSAEEPAAEEAVEEAVSEEAAPETEAVPETAPKKKSKTGLIVGLVLAVLLVVAVIVGKSQYDRANAAGKVDSGYHTNAYGYESYGIHYETAEDGSIVYTYMDETGNTVTADPESVEAAMAQVVAVCGSLEMDNVDLNYYYNQAYYNFYSMYSSYLAYFMNSSLGLDEQMDLNGESTWQRYFMDSAVDMFCQVAALYQEAQAAGYTLTAEEQAYLDSNTDFDTMAASYGFESGEAFLQAQFGPSATVESYVEFLEINMLANSYANHLMEQVEVTADEVQAYYDENVDMMTTSYGIEKIDKNVVNVRHILIQPESTTADDGTSTITDEAWAAAEAEAQRIYEEWLAGDADEDSFAELANTYSTDGGSNTVGGLYEDVYPGQMVAEFNDWCFADGRMVGDHTIVKTTYGYHIMFFSGEGDYVYWEKAAEDLCRQEKAAQERAELTAAYETTVDLTKALILDYMAPTAPSAAEEETAATE